MGKIYNVSLEINMESDTPLNAAKQVEEMLADNPKNLIYFVQDDETNEIFNIDLDESDEYAVIPAYDYSPIINNKDI